MAESKKTAGQKKDNSLKWLVIICLFGVGLWPIGIFLLLGWDRLTGKTARHAAERRARSAQLRIDEAISTAEGKQAPAAATWEKPKKPTLLQKLKDTLHNGTLLMAVGVLLLIVGLPAVVEEIGWALSGYDPIWDYLLVAATQTAGGGLLLWQGQRQAGMSRRAKKYLRAMGGVDAVPLTELAKRMGLSREKMVRELERLTSKEYLEDLYIDHEAEYFLRYGAKIRQPVKKAEAAPPPPPQQPEEVRYQEILRKIRGANDRIAGEELSAKIDQLEQITGKILGEIAAHPEKKESLHTFFDYYLPTTLKLLDAYADFEAAGVEGENLRDAKQRIEATMDGIVAGFAHQLDELYRLDALDVASDIQVMESMLQRDTASAEKDFGLPQQ